MRTRTPFTCTVVLVAASLLGAAGCAGNDSSGGDTADAAPRTVKPVAGCGAGSWTDPSDLAPDRKPARCDKGAPAARPLAKKRKIVLATGTLSAEYVAPLQVALAKGEFAKEGLDVQLKVLPTPDALPLLAKGDVDAQWAAPEAAVMNGINGGFDIKWVAGNFSPTRPPRAACGCASRTARAPVTSIWPTGNSAR